MSFSEPACRVTVPPLSVMPPPPDITITPANRSRHEHTAGRHESVPARTAHDSALEWRLNVFQSMMLIHVVFNVHIQILLIILHPIVRHLDISRCHDST